MLDATLRNKFDEPKDKVTRDDVQQAMQLREDWANPPMTRSVFSKTAGKSHRTLMKKRHGVKTGTVTHITCFPVSYAQTLAKEDVNKLAQKAIVRRTDLSWNSFNQFKDDAEAICLTETVVNAGDKFYVCSCIDGVKGSKPCIHVLVMELENGDREPVNTKPIARSVRKAGRPKKNAKQQY